MAVLRPAGEFDESYAYVMATLRRPWQWGLLGLFILALYTLPLYASPSVVSLVNRIGITIIAVQGLNLLTGYTGQISLGQAAFMTTGGYISALLVNNLGWSFFLALPAAAVGAGLVGLLFGLPSLRVKGAWGAPSSPSAIMTWPRNCWGSTSSPTSSRLSSWPRSTRALPARSRLINCGTSTLKPSTSPIPSS